ncbi:MAG: hypothetical protein HYV90_01515 [Candidatus Woesebacteria bacterium]|nr:MAG: hypothetical protein HYV90_01515 [Candidatus Woesebacteria bacterium]
MQNIDYGKIIKRSWELTWKNKWLWVMGLVLAAFGGGSSGGSGGGGGSSSSNVNIPDASPSPNPTNIQNIREQTSYVLGEATNIFKNWVTGIPVGTWILLGLLILIVAVFTTAVLWVLTSWAKGALIAGLNMADMDEAVDLKKVSPKGIAKIKDLIIFNLISFGITTVLILGLIFIIGIGFLIKLLIPVLGIIWLILFGIVGVLGFIVAMVLFVMLSIYAERLIVLKDYSPWKAWKKGLSLSKGNFIPTFVMGIINSAIGCASGCVGLLILGLALGIPGYFLIAPSFDNGFHFPGAGQIIGIAILFLVFVSINSLIKAVFIVFNYGNWNLLFKEIFKEETKDE